jgi:hypothetical protein
MEEMGNTSRGKAAKKVLDDRMSKVLHAPSDTESSLLFSTDSELKSAKSKKKSRRTYKALANVHNEVHANMMLPGYTKAGPSQLPISPKRNETPRIPAATKCKAVDPAEKSGIPYTGRQ